VILFNRFVADDVDDILVPGKTIGSDWSVRELKSPPRNLFTGVRGLHHKGLFRRDEIWLGDHPGRGIGLPAAFPSEGLPT